MPRTYDTFKQIKVPLMFYTLKSFLAPSFANEFHGVVGQYFNYVINLEVSDKERELYLAVPVKIWNKKFQDAFIQHSVNRMQINIFLYNIESKKIEKWIPFNQK